MLSHTLLIRSKPFRSRPRKVKNLFAQEYKNKNKICINLNTNRPIRALLVVHVFGHLAKILQLKAVAKVSFEIN